MCRIGKLCKKNKIGVICANFCLIVCQMLLLSIYKKKTEWKHVAIHSTLNKPRISSEGRLCGIVNIPIFPSVKTCTIWQHREHELDTIIKIFETIINNTFGCAAEEQFRNPHINTPKYRTFSGLFKALHHGKSICWPMFIETLVRSTFSILYTISGHYGSFIIFTTTY